MKKRKVGFSIVALLSGFLFVSPSVIVGIDGDSFSLMSSIVSFVSSPAGRDQAATLSTPATFKRPASCLRA
jgi:hypothetical protein